MLKLCRFCAGNISSNRQSHFCKGSNFARNIQSAVNATRVLSSYVDDPIGLEDQVVKTLQGRFAARA